MYVNTAYNIGLKQGLTYTAFQNSPKIVYHVNYEKGCIWNMIVKIFYALKTNIHEISCNLWY